MLNYHDAKMKKFFNKPNPNLWGFCQVFPMFVKSVRIETKFVLSG